MIQKQIISNNIIKGFKAEIKSAVAIVVNENNELLLGLSNDSDERNGKWVFLGGGVDKGESPLQAAIREAYEEGGVSAKPLHVPMIVHPSKPSVGFFVLQCDSRCEIIKNEEFDDIKWFSLTKLPKQTLSLNIDVLKLIGKSK